MNAAGSPATAPPRRARLRRVFAVVVVAHVLALYWPRVGLQGPVTWTDKVVHVLLFATPVLVAVAARLPRLPWVVTALAAHAPLSEWLQHTVLPHRSGDPWDAVADLAGVVVGVTLGMVGRRRGRW